MDDIYAVDPTRALPAQAYREAAFEAEVDRIWRNDWIWVGTADQVAKPGDYFSAELGGQPIIVLRNQDGDLSALGNMCAHRGTMLVEGGGNTKRFQCPYHAWTYADDGRLLAAPYTKKADVDRDDHCLPQYRAEEWFGLVFASLNPDVAPLSERLAHLAPLAEEHEMASLQHWTAEREHEVWDANWKLIVTNAMESYHLFKVHEDTLEPMTPTADAYYIVGNADGAATGGITTYGPDYVLFSLAPNLVGVLSDDSFQWQAVHPVAHDRSNVTLGGAYRYESPGAQSGLSKYTARVGLEVVKRQTPKFLPEDKWICERGQRSYGGDFQPGVLVPMEHIVSDFHHYLNRQLHGAEVPAVRRSPDAGLDRKDDSESKSAAAAARGKREN